MFSHEGRPGARHFFAWMLPLLTTAAILLSLVLPVAAPAADPLRETTSLKFVPSGVAFYISGLRNGEQWRAFTGSKAYAKLMSMPAVQLAIAQIQVLWSDADNAELKAFKEFLAQPENKELIELAADAAGSEIFIYGDSSYADLLELANGVNRITNSARLEALREGDDPTEAIAKKLAEFLAKNGDKLKMPDTLIGFKLSDAKRAERQLARLEKVLGEALADEPKLKMRLQREQIAGASFLSLDLDGSLIPWDDIPLDDVELDEEILNKVIERIKKLTLKVSLGVRDGYLLLSIGDTSEHLAALGKGKLLIDRPEFAPAVKAGDKRFTSLSYVSEEFTSRLAAGQGGQFDDLVNMARQGLPLSGLDEELQKELIADAEILSADLKKMVPKPGAAMSYEFLTPRGFEGFAYNWAELKGIDGSKPLSILDHVGSDPILFVAARSKSSAEDNQFVTKWSQKAVYYLEKIGLSELDEEQRKTYDKFRKDVEPLLKRLGKATTDMLVPALADGQSAVVLEAKTTSKTWHAGLPPSAKPLPLLELAIVHSVSDAELLKKAAGEYFAIVQDVLDKLHKALPDDVPEIKLPAPQTKVVAGGTLYYYDLPAEWGLDKQLVPNAGLTKAFGVLSYSPSQTARLLETKPVPSTGPLAHRTMPLAAASSFNFPALVDALTPWIDYGFDIVTGLQTDVGGAGLLMQADEGSIKFIKEQIAIALDVLKCFKGGSSVSYVEGKALVTHFEWQFQDLK